MSLDFLTEQIRAELATFVRSEIERVLSERALLTVEEFAAMSGLSVKSIYHRVERGQLQHIRYGARVFIPAFELRPR